MTNSRSWRAVLGIGAAWTAAEPSGVAAAVETASGWTLAAVEASYEAFVGRANGVERDAKRPGVSAADLRSARRPRRRRYADGGAGDCRAPALHRAISKQYDAKAASTHSPSAERPGKINDPLRARFEAHGYRLCTSAPARGLIGAPRQEAARMCG
jgi:hypothetical protein